MIRPILRLSCITLLLFFSTTIKASDTEAISQILDRLSPSELRDLQRNPIAVREFLHRQALFQEIERRALTADLLQNLSVERQIMAKRREVLFETLQKRFVADHAAPREAVATLAEDYYAAFQDRYHRPRRVKVAQISVRTDHCAPETTVAILQGLVGRVRAGEHFADLAREFSDAPNAPQGGLIREWVVDTPKMHGSEFFGPALALDRVGEMTEPFEYGDAHHLLMIVADKRPDIIPFEELKDRMEAMIRKVDGQVLSQRFVNSLEQSAKPPITEDELLKAIEERKATSGGQAPARQSGG